MIVFGRLDIHYPDGRSESQLLEGESVTVGRASDNDIRLDDATVSPHHLRFDHSAGIARLRRPDAKNDRPRVLAAVENIVIGDLRLTYYQRSDSPTEVMSALSEGTQPLSIGLRASLEHSEISVWPGSSAAVDIIVSNLGAEDADVLLETDGLPEGWVEPARLVFSLAAAETKPLALLIKPLRRADSPAGDYQLKITLARRSAPERQLHLRLRVALGGFGGLSLALAPVRIADRSRLTLHLLNQGNEDLPLRLAIWEPAAHLDIQLERDAITLAPGKRAQIGASVTTRHRPLFGRPQALPLAIQARAQIDSNYLVALPAHVSVAPRLTHRGAALLAVAAAVLLLLAALLVQPPMPEISSFTLAQSTVAQGTPVALNWTGAHSQRFAIEVDGALIVELPADASSYLLNTRDYVDPVTIALIARQGEKTAIASRQLGVYQPVTLRRFNADKDTMFRHVSDSLTVSWDVAGAVNLNISLPPNFETVRERGRGAAQGEIVLRGQPAEAFQIVLLAEDEIGGISEFGIDIALRAPECTPRIDAPLHTGPDSRFPLMSVAVRNVPVLVSGTVAGGQWLQVELASGQRGWGASQDFICPGFDRGALRLIRDFPPTPTDAATYTPPPTVTAAATHTDTPAPTAFPTASVTAAPAESPAAASAQQQ